jgi:hypothetical protein
MMNLQKGKKRKYDMFKYKNKTFKAKWIVIHYESYAY